MTFPVEVEHLVNDHVLIGPPEAPIAALVSSILIQAHGIQYQCTYWKDQDYKSVWLNSCEIRKKDE